MQVLAGLRRGRSTLCPQTVECTEHCDCCFRDQYNEDIAKLLWDGSKHFHALQQLGSQRERIVTEQGKMSLQNHQWKGRCAWRTRVQHGRMARESHNS